MVYKWGFSAAMKRAYAGEISGLVIFFFSLKEKEKEKSVCVCATSTWH